MPLVAVALVGLAAWAIEERATQSHGVWAKQDTEDSAAADVEHARRKAVSAKVSVVAEKARKLHAHASY